MSIEVSPTDLTEDAIFQASLIPIQNTTNTVIKRKRVRPSKAESEEKSIKKPRKAYVKKIKPTEQEGEDNSLEKTIEIIQSANRRHENKIEYPLRDSEISKDALVTYSKISHKFDKLIGVSDKEHILKMSKIVTLFKNSFPYPAIYNEQTNEINHFIKEKYEDKFHNTIINNKLIKDSLNNQNIIEKSKKIFKSTSKQKLTLDDTTKIYELSDNEVMKIPSQVCGLDIHGFVINHGLKNQVIDSVWMNYGDRSFYIVSKLIKEENHPYTFLENPEDHRLSTFNLSTKNKQIYGNLEIWELRKDLGLILMKTYAHNLGVLKDIQIIPGTFSSFDNEASKNNVSFLISAYCTSESVQLFQLNTSPVANPASDSFIKNSILKIKLKNDIISCYCLIQEAKNKEDSESLKLCIGSVNGKIYIYDLDVSTEIPTKVFKVSESIISSIKSANSSPIVCCSSISGNVLIVDTSSNITNAFALSKTRWISPPIVAYTEYPKSFLYTDGMNTLYNSPLNMLDLKSCSASRNSKINCLGMSQQHPYVLIGTLNGEVTMENICMKTLASRKNQPYSELVKMFEWNYDEVKKVYQLDPSKKIEKAYDNLLKPDTGMKYQGCALLNTHWVQNNSGERYFSFVNYAGLSVITKID